jgi:hypothetical protein
MGTRVHRYSQTTRDANEESLLQVAQAMGGRWHEGPPLDGWILWRGLWLPVEIKMPEREGHKDEYTPAQRRFLRFCENHRGPHLIWRTVDDVIQSLNGRRSA